MAIELILEEDGRETRYEFEEDSLTIGRTADNGVRVRSPLSSRQHCRVAKTTAGVVVEDLKSRNGTHLNGRLVTKSFLSPGDQISIGESIIHFARRRGPGSAPDHVAVTTAEEPAPLEPAASRYRLEHLGSSRRPAVMMARFPFTIGAAAGNDLSIDEAELQDKHCMIVEGGDGLMLVDLGTGATFVDGSAVSSQQLAHGLELMLGVGLGFRFVDGAEVPDAAPKAKKRRAQKPAKVEVEEVSDLDDLDDLEEVVEAAPESPRPSRAARADGDQRGSASRSRRVKKKGGSRRKSRRAEQPAEPLLEEPDDGFGRQLSQVDLGAVESSGGGQVQLVAMIGLLVLLFGSVAVTFGRLVEGVGADADPGDVANMTQNWSFEEALRASDSGLAIPGWLVTGSSPSDPFRLVPGRHGQQALRANLTEGAEVEVESREVMGLGTRRPRYRLSATFSVDGECLAGVKARWFDEEDRLMSTSVALIGAPRGVRRIAGFVRPPKGASGLRMVAFARARGPATVTFDRLECLEDIRDEESSPEVGDGPVEAALEVAATRLSADDRGLAKIALIESGAPRVIVANFGLFLWDPVAQEPMHYGNQGAGRIDEATRQKKQSLKGHGALYDIIAGRWRPYTTSIESQRDGFKLRCGFIAGSLEPGQQIGLGFDLPSMKDVSPVQLIGRGGRHRRLVELFEEARGEGETGERDAISVSDIQEVSLGSEGAQRAIRFTSPATLIARRDGSAVSLSFIVAPVASATGKGLQLSCELLSSSTVVQQRLRDMLERATAARAGGDLGAALSLYREVLKRFGFDEFARDQARRQIKHIEGRIGAYERELAVALDDAEGLGDALILESSLARLQAFESLVGASSLAAGAKSSVSRLKELAQRGQRAELERRAQQLVALATRYRERRQRGLARATLRVVVESFPEDLQCVQAAKRRLQNLGGK